MLLRCVCVCARACVLCRSFFLAEALFVCSDFVLRLMLELGLGQGLESILSIIKLTLCVPARMRVCVCVCPAVKLADIVSLLPLL